MSPELKELLDQARARYEAMTPGEQAAMWKTQREGYLRAEMSWRSRSRMVDGVLVYDSYADYCA